MGKGKMCVGHWVAFALMFVGALNWGLVGAFNFNLVNTLFGGWPVVERVLYALVGLSALFMLMMGKCKGCGGMGDSCCKTEGGNAGGSCGHGGGCNCGEKKM